MFTLEDIIKITSAKSRYAGAGVRVNGVSTDSRTIKRNELFVALKGARFDGTEFITEVSKKGAAAAIIGKECKVLSNIPLIKVEDTLTALGNLARAHRKKFHIPVIGIAGSNGKTTTKEILSYILGKRFSVLKTEGNNNNKVGVANTLLRLRNETIAVIEVGTSLKGEIAYNSKILAPTIAVTTNIGFSHLKGLGSKTGVLREKIAIVESLGKGGIWVRNCDDKLLTKNNYSGVRVVDFGIKNKKAGLSAKDITLSNRGVEFYINNTRINLPLLGIHNVYNALAAVSTASIFMDMKMITGSLPGFQSASMRMEVMDCGTFTIINDAYNSNPASFKSAVSTLKDYKCKGKKIICCADMLELGNTSEMLHYDCGSFIADAKAADMLILFGKRATLIGKGAIDNGMNKDKVKQFRNKKDIADFLRQIIGQGDTVLVKGSRSMKMEEIAEALIPRHDVIPLAYA